MLRRWLLALLVLPLLAGCGAAPAVVASPTPTAVVPAPAVAYSPLAQQLAGALAQECSDMTAAQILSAADAEVTSYARAGESASVERILYIAVATPNMVTNLQTCAATIQTAAMFDAVYDSPPPTPTVAP